MISEQENPHAHRTHHEMLISKKEALKRLEDLEEWSLQDNSIVREFSFIDFVEAMSFVKDVADIAEQENHHPDIFISYNKVRLTLSTHKLGGLTNKDFKLAHKVNQLL